MFAEVGKYQGQVVWLKVSAKTSEESKLLERLFEYLSLDVEEAKDKVFQLARNP